jgi:hypothetical protein
VFDSINSLATPEGQAKCCKQRNKMAYRSPCLSDPTAGVDLQKVAEVRTARKGKKRITVAVQRGS